jgi:hypothetical protein
MTIKFRRADQKIGVHRLNTSNNEYLSVVLNRIRINSKIVFPKPEPSLRPIIREEKS